MQKTIKPLFVPGTEIPVSFQFALCNVDVLKVESRKNKESIIVLYIGATKVGYIYEGDKLSKQKQFEIFRDYAPDDKNDLRDFKIKFSERINYYSAQPDSYLMVSEKVVEKQTNNKFKLL
jgi:hypothetical protein